MGHQPLVFGEVMCQVVKVGGIALLGVEVLHPDRQRVVPGIALAMHDPGVRKQQGHQRQLVEIEWRLVADAQGILRRAIPQHTQVAMGELTAFRNVEAGCGSHARLTALAGGLGCQPRQVLQFAGPVYKRMRGE